MFFNILYINNKYLKKIIFNIIFFISISLLSNAVIAQEVEFGKIYPGGTNNVKIIQENNEITIKFLDRDNNWVDVPGIGSDFKSSVGIVCYLNPDNGGYGYCQSLTDDSKCDTFDFDTDLPSPEHYSRTTNNNGIGKTCLSDVSFVDGIIDLDSYIEKLNNKDNSGTDYSWVHYLLLSEEELENNLGSPSSPESSPVQLPNTKPILPNPRTQEPVQKVQIINAKLRLSKHNIAGVEKFFIETYNSGIKQWMDIDPSKTGYETAVGCNKVVEQDTNEAVNCKLIGQDGNGNNLCKDIVISDINKLDQSLSDKITPDITDCTEANPLLAWDALNSNFRLGVAPTAPSAPSSDAPALSDAMLRINKISDGSGEKYTVEVAENGIWVIKGETVYKSNDGSIVNHQAAVGCAAKDGNNRTCLVVSENDCKEIVVDTIWGTVVSTKDNVKCYENNTSYLDIYNNFPDNFKLGAEPIIHPDKVINEAIGTEGIDFKLRLAFYKDYKTDFNSPSKGEHYIFEKYDASTKKWLPLHNDLSLELNTLDMSESVAIGCWPKNNSLRTCFVVKSNNDCKEFIVNTVNIDSPEFVDKGYFCSKSSWANMFDKLPSDQKPVFDPGFVLPDK